MDTRERAHSALPQMNSKDLSKQLIIIIVNYNGWPHTIECLESLLRSDRRNFKIIIVDNASTDNSAVHFRAWAVGLVDAWVPSSNPHRSKIIPPLVKPLPVRAVNDQFQDVEGSEPTGEIVWVQSSRNGGFGAGNNLGMACAFALGFTPGFFWLLNNDTVVSAETVGAILDALTEDRRVWGTWLMEYSAPEEIQVVGGCRLTRFAKRAIPCRTVEEALTLDYIQGASMVFPSKFFLESGGFDESIFMYFEDPDLCFQACEKGYELSVLGARIYHKGGVSSHSVRQWTWTYQHKFYVLHKHFGWGFWALASGFNLLAVAISPGVPSAKRQAARAVLWKGLCLQLGSTPD